LPHSRLEWAILILAVLLGGGAWTLASRVTPEDAAPGSLPPAPRVGFAAPDFTASTLDNATVRLADLRGRPVVLNFWATWCPPCLQEIPHLIDAARGYDNRVVILGIDNGEPAATVRTFADDRGLNYPIVLDPTFEITDLYRVDGLPTTFFIDQDGIIREMMMGPLTPATLQDKLATIVTAP
jgi:cytochrome c biogenesis protein CcmG/thiol:disulfide interchange protein DsbE